MGNPPGEEGSPISVVSALRLTRKGRLSYDRHWGERGASVERVLKEVTGSIETLGLYEEQEIREENVDGKAEEGEVEEEGGVRVGEGESEGKAHLEEPHMISLTVTQDCSGSPPPSLPSMITLPLLRDCEREVIVRKASILFDDEENEEDSANKSLLNCSHNTSQLVSHDSSVLDLSLFSYSTPEMLRVVSSRRSPRVLLPKIRIPDFLLGDKETHKNNGSEGDCSEEEGDEHLNEEVPIQSPIEEELLVYEERRREEALRRQQERKKRWEEEAEKLAEDARHRLEVERRKSEEEEEGGAGGLQKESRLSDDQIERRLEERLREAQVERETRQRELIQQARKEEQEAIEEGERRSRAKRQVERLVPIHTRIKGRVQAVLAFWTSEQDKSVFSEEVTMGVPAVLSQYNSLLKEARDLTAEGRAGEELFGRLDSLEKCLGGILSQVEVDKSAKLEKEREKVEDERRRGEEESRRQKEELEEKQKKEAEQAAAAAQAQATTAATTTAVAPQASATTPAPVVTLSPGTLETSCSPANSNWHAQIVQFKADFVKDVVFTDAEKPYKFNLQKAVNTPLNSLSGVSSKHLQDKVDKLVTLFSGGVVTVAEKPLSAESHPHAKKFCMALAAKKLRQQGEDVVSSNPQAAFSAATLAIAVWDKFPEFGYLLLAYIFETCPFLVPLHPQRPEGQSDKDWYQALGYKYEANEVEKQDKYLKRLSGVARLYAALSVAHLPKSSTSNLHSHPLKMLWQWLASLSSLTPHTDVTATVLLQVLEVGSHTLASRYGHQFWKLLQLLEKSYMPLMEGVKSEEGPTARLQHLLSSAIKQGGVKDGTFQWSQPHAWPLKEPEGALRPGFI